MNTFAGTEVILLEWRSPGGRLCVKKMARSFDGGFQVFQCCETVERIFLDSYHNIGAEISGRKTACEESDALFFCWLITGILGF